MNVNTIIIPKNEALAKLADYKALNQSQKTREDERLQSLYQAVSKGARVVNIASAFKQAGLNQKGQPKLAISRADWKTVHFHPRRCIINGDRSFTPYYNLEGAGLFTDTPRFVERAYQKSISVPGHTFSTDLTRSNLKSRVPHIPPSIRPKIHLRNYHILFEVQNWEEYPVDPFLLRRIDGYLYVVEAEWELTELEASILGSLTGN
jgi:hypothetical protein